MTQAASNVVPLPTAAPRKVRQCWSRTRKADREALLRFPWERTFSPKQRDALNSARILAQIEPHAAMTFASAIWQVLNDLDRIKVQAMLAMAASNEAMQALEWTRYLSATVGDRASVEFMLKRISRGEIR